MSFFDTVEKSAKEFVTLFSDLEEKKCTHIRCSIYFDETIIDFNGEVEDFTLYKNTQVFLSFCLKVKLYKHSVTLVYNSSGDCCISFCDDSDKKTYSKVFTHKQLHNFYMPWNCLTGISIIDMTCSKHRCTNAYTINGKFMN